MVRHWLCVTNLENWKVIKERGVWGVDDRYQYTLKHNVSVDDVLIFYVTGMGIAGIYKVSSPYQYDETELGFVKRRKKEKKIVGETYPHRVSISPIIIPKAPVPLDESLRKELIFITDKGKTWEMSVFPTMVLIPKEDYDTIYRKLSELEMRKTSLDSYLIR